MNNDSSMNAHRHAVSAASRTALLSVNGAAAYMGVSRWKVYDLVRRGDLQALRAGERLRFRPEDLDSYLERGSP